MNMDEIIVNGNTLLQATHFFVYEGEKFPFNMKLFKCFSQYFQTNKNRFKNITDINIFDDSDEKFDLTESTIKDFINFCQSKNITLNKENATCLHKLAKKFNVPLLINSTNEFIQIHQKEVVVDLLILNLKDGNFDISRYEELISNDLPYYINDDKLLLLPIPVLYNIVNKYHQKNSEQTNNDQICTQITEFLFKCLDKYGRAASVLFDHIDLSRSKNNALNRLLYEYSEIFDFHFINSQLLKTVYDLESELIEKTKKMTNEQAAYKKEIQDLIQKQEEKSKEKDDLIQLKRKEIDGLIQQQEERNKENDKKVQSLIQQQEERNKENDKKVQSLIHQQEERNKENDKKVQSLIHQQEERNKENDKKVQSLIQQQEEKIMQIQSDFKSKLNDLNEKVRQLTEKLKEEADSIDQLKQKQEKMEKPTPLFSCRFISENKPKGIISKLGDSVTLTCAVNDDPDSYPLINITKFDDSGYINYNRGSGKSEADTYITFDFGASRKIDLYSYFIHSVGYHPKTWRIDGSNDQSIWTQVDRQVDDQNLNKGNHQHHFYCKEVKHGDPSHRYRFIRYAQESSHSGDFLVYLRFFELYGDVFNNS